MNIAKIFSRQFLGVFIMLGISLSLLNGCAPKFKIKDYHNNLRGTHVCQMENNIVKKTNCKGTVNFNLLKDTEHKPPYGLTILISALDTSPAFRDDSYADLCLTRNGQQEILKLVSSCASHNYNEQINTTPGYFVDGIYIPGSVYTTTYAFSGLYFPLTKRQIMKIVNADCISFEVETTGSRTVTGVLSPENINNIKQYGCQCFTD